LGCGESAEEKPAKTKAKAQAGDAEAQNSLGLMYEKGQGVEQDFKEA
jgi:TPR repeat protein